MSTAPRRAAFALLAFLATPLSAVPLATAIAGEVVVLTAGAYKPILLDVTGEYETASRETLGISNDTAGGVSARIGRGEEVDLVVLPMAGLAALEAQGKIAPGTAVPLAKSGIGVVVKEGAPKPDISTADAFKKVMLATPSFAMIDPAAGGSSGIYLAKLFETRGIAEQLKRKTVLVPGGLTASRVDNGEAAMALQQISELRAVRGVQFVGPLPAEIQNYTIYGGAIPAKARRPEAGKALLLFLQSDAGQRALAARGLEKP